MENTKQIDALVLLSLLLLSYYAAHAQCGGLDELADKKPAIPTGICYERKHPCIGGLCWCCYGDHCLSVHTAADGSDGQPDAYYREDVDCAQPSSIEPAPIVAAEWVHTYFAKLVAC
ncbi:hypothetical protein PVAP13_2NG124200 [Panicum virgatum]|uniref:Meg domain-containing protein n=1 Tax=Panicum virgatum TaxID=38727 RepID=A0A8T0VHH5_PANVG|nr:hypothetical protein PVAP13_2NG124200 [Panicum virgatum]